METQITLTDFKYAYLDERISVKFVETQAVFDHSHPHLFVLFVNSFLSACFLSPPASVFNLFAHCQRELR